MKLKRFNIDSLNESQGVMYFADKKPELSEENQKLDIIERLSQHWNEKLKTDFLAPRSLYSYSLDELKEIEKYYLTESNNYCDFGYDYISKFVEEHPEYDNEDFFEYVSAHNKADRDMGELQDISKEEIDRLADEWKHVKESLENPVVKQLGIIDLYRKLRFAAYDNYPRIKDKERYLRKLDNLFNHYQIWAGSYNDINYKSDLIELMTKINQFMDAYDLPIDKFHRFEIEKINFDRFNLKESYYVGIGEEINKLRDILKDSGYGHNFEIKDNKLYFLASEDQETFDKIENVAKEHGFEIKLESKEYLKRIVNLTDEKIDTSKPSIFQYTIYRLPTEEELNEFSEFPNLTAKEIKNGFSYTIIGKGIKTAKNQQMIIDSIQMLIDKYPENEEYKKALEIAKGELNILNDKKGIWSKYENYDPKLVETLHELKQQHSTNDAVEDIRIEGDEIVFDVKCETDVQSVTEYNGFKLRFNYLCNIDEHEEKSEEEILEHAKMIKEKVINQYIEKLFESPDNITTLDPDRKNTTYSSYDDKDVAKPFAFIIKNDKVAKYKLKPEDLGELWIGYWSESHFSNCPFLVQNGGNYLYDELFLGRLWFRTSHNGNTEPYDIKILSTWVSLINNVELIQHIVTEIEKADYDLSDWSYDTGNYIYIITDEYKHKVKVTRTIPLKELGITFLEDSQKSGDNLFRKKFKKNTPLMYRQAIYGENKIYNFEEYLKIKSENEKNIENL